MKKKRKADYGASLRGKNVEEPAFDDSFITESRLCATPLSRQKEQRPKWPSRQVAIIGGVCAITLLALVFPLLGYAGSTPDKPQERLPLPSLVVQNEIAKQVNELGEDAKTAAEKVKSAKQLIKLAEATQKPEERFVIRRKAAELASDAGQLGARASGH